MKNILFIFLIISTVLFADPTYYKVENQQPVLSNTPQIAWSSTTINIKTIPDISIPAFFSDIQANSSL